MNGSDSKLLFLRFTSMTFKIYMTFSSTLSPRRAVSHQKSLLIISSNSSFGSSLPTSSAKSAMDILPCRFLMTASALLISFFEAAIFVSIARFCSSIPAIPSYNDDRYLKVCFSSSETSFASEIKSESMFLYVTPSASTYSFFPISTAATDFAFVNWMFTIFLSLIFLISFLILFFLLHLQYAGFLTAKKRRNK